MHNKVSDDNAMLKGVAQLLGFKEYESKASEEVCKHSSDGFIYGKTKHKYTLRCEKCGVLYDQDK